jgi:hypothetical protein
MKVLREPNPTRIWLSRISRNYSGTEETQKEYNYDLENQKLCAVFWNTIIRNFSVNSKSEVTNGVKVD